VLWKRRDDFVPVLVRGGPLLQKPFTDFISSFNRTVQKRGRDANVRSPQNIEAVRVAMQRSPGKTTRKAEAELRISRRSVQRILHNDLHLYPYKMTVVHELTARDKTETGVCCVGRAQRSHNAQCMVFR
jgi:hypothetical protein